MQRIVVLVFVVFAYLYASSQASPAAADEPRSLLQTIGEWQYPGAELSASQASDGETVDSKGNRTVPSVVSKTVMTTGDPVDKVLEYYRAKLSPSAKAAGPRAEPSNATGRSVDFTDESEGRPFALHTVIINTDDTSTTLVISRGKDEAKTHISWKQYHRFHR